MKSIRSFVWNFYLPLLLSLFLIFLLVFSPKFVAVGGSEIEVGAEVSVLGIKMPLPLWIEKVWIIRCTIILAALISLIKALTLDFSKYFPKSVSIDVYLDEKGIERSLRCFTDNEQSELKILQDWKKHIGSYDDEVKSSLGKLWKKRQLRDMPDLSDFSRDLIHARGATTFVVKRVSLLHYRIVESSGRLNFDWDVPKKPRRSFCTVFELRESANNHIHPNIVKLLRCGGIVLTPEFKQIFSTEVEGHHATFDHAVIGLTKIYLFPFPRFTDTIYLWKLPTDGVVPVAYAVNFDGKEDGE